MPDLMSIPREMRLKIAEYLNLNRDKKSMCLTCKEFRIVCTPLLYKHMTVDIEDLDATFASTLAVPENHNGVRYIRGLYVRTGMNGKEWFSTSGYTMPRLYSLLSAIPQDRLTHFVFSTRGTHFFCLAIDRLLFLRQRRLSNYHYHPDFHGNIHSVVAPNADALAFITSVHLRLHRREDHIRAASVVHRIPAVTELMVHAKSAKDWNNLEEIKFIFGGAYTTNKRFPHLKKLVLKNMSFLRTRSLIAKMVDFEQLETLHLIRCCGIEHFLMPVSLLRKDFKSLRIEASTTGLLTTQEETAAFFKSITATQDLFIYCVRTSVGWNPDWASKIAHAATLRSLRVNIFPGHGRHDSYLEPYHFHLKSMSRLLKSAPNLQRLALRGPAIEEDMWMGKNGFLAWLDCLKAACKLELLEILMFPECLAYNRVLTSGYFDADSPADYTGQYSNSQISPIFQCVADQVFRTLGRSCPEFVALLFTAQLHIDAPSPSYRFAFIRSEVVGSMGRTTYKATAVDSQELNEYDFYSGIFEMDDKRTTTVTEQRRLHIKE